MTKCFVGLAVVPVVVVVLIVVVVVLMVVVVLYHCFGIGAGITKALRYGVS